MARVDLSTLADDTSPGGRLPRFADSASRSIATGLVAPNPFNTRDLQRRAHKIDEIADSMKTLGQLQPCPVVTRAAFLRTFPECESSVDPAAQYVQIAGGRRRLAAIKAGIPLEIEVKDKLGGARADFLAATASENLDRENLDIIEEAKAVALMIKEKGSAQEAATTLRRSAPWVTQRRNLLKLAPEVQEALREELVPFRAVRSWHNLDSSEQLRKLAEWQRTRDLAVRAADTSASNDGSAKPKAKLPPVVAAIRKLGDSPPKIAESLRSALSPEEIESLIAHLLKR